MMISRRLYGGLYVELRRNGILHESIPNILHTGEFRKFRYKKKLLNEMLSNA